MAKAATASSAGSKKKAAAPTFSSSSSSSSAKPKAKKPSSSSSTPPPPPPPSDTTQSISRIDAAQAAKAVQALLTHHAKHQATKKSQGGKQDLLASEAGDFVLVQLALARIPERISPKPIPIPLPHPLHGAADAEEEHAVCLIVKDSDKSKVTKALATLKLEGMSEVVGLQELRTDYREWAERRKLRDGRFFSSLGGT